MRSYSYQKSGKTGEKANPTTNLQSLPANISNSVYLDFAEEQTTGVSYPDLEALMTERMENLGRQRPKAEQEADRLSQGIHGTTFEAVKAEMGQRLGADLSDVRVHTDGIAAAKADGMGANAYTTGLDIYFGSGGFEPGTVAHEIVHTVQQGAVEGQGLEVSVPMGTVQMDPINTLLHSQKEYSDMEFNHLRGLVRAYNEATDEEEKNSIERELMSAASVYISKYSTRETPVHKTRTTNAEDIIFQLSRGNGRYDDALYNLMSMRAISGTTTGLQRVLDETSNGVGNGMMLGKQLSPALRGILIETMASQTDTKLSQAGQPAFHLEPRGGVRLNVVGPVDERQPLEVNQLASFFHESTHSQGYNLFGSLVTMLRGDLDDSEIVKTEEKQRLAAANSIIEATSVGPRPTGKEAEALNSIGMRMMYGMTGGMTGGESYVDRAVAGFRAEGAAIVPRDVRYEDQARVLRQLKETREHTPGLLPQNESTLVEFDPSLNEALMQYELKSYDRSSLAYRRLKAAAIRAHVNRHNAAIR